MVVLSVWTVIAVLAIAGGLIGIRRVRNARHADDTNITDDMIRSIVDRGRIEVEEPLDFDAIQDEESRFWEETWDEPEEL
jgi:hypothetical protein